MSSHTLQILFIFLFFLFTGIVLACGFYIIKRNGSPFPRLFHEFDKKMWMTLGLGILFFGFYFLLISILSWAWKDEAPRNLLGFFYKYKVHSIYLGLTIFAFFTLSIYLARLLIKYLYKKHNS